jgi:DNA-binding CsgD family transcriptional regulator
MLEGLSALVLNSAANHNEWQKVLEALVNATGARYGVMSLRDLDTAGMSFPEETATSLSAPLIVGIEPDFIASYFDHYWALDAWTDVERSYHPHTPYFMSEHLPLAELRKTTFYEAWLEPQGVSECLVAEVHLSQKNWIALNLGFGEKSSELRAQIFTLVGHALPIMRTGWQLSERLLGLSYAQSASARHLENEPLPCLILNEDQIVTSINAKGVAEFSKHLPLMGHPVIGSLLPLRAGHASKAIAELIAKPKETLTPPASVTIASDHQGYEVNLSVLAFGSDIVGRRRNQLLVVAKSKGLPSNLRTPSRRIWESSTLTPAQSAMVRWIAEGGQASDYAVEHRIVKKTAYDHLFAARQKLGGISARDIYTIHQTQLATER